MEEIILEGSVREETGRGKLRQVRSNGFIPAVVYKDGKESIAIKLPCREFMHLLHEYRLENAVISLKVQGEKKAKGRPCVIKEIQYHPVHGDVLHVDLNEISLTKVIKVNVPVVAKGESIGVRQEGGSIEHILWEVEIECLPTNIPKEFEVDVSALKIGDAVHIKDMVFPENIKVLQAPDAIVLHVASPQKEEVAVPEEGAEKAEPEVIKEKKEVPAEEKAEEKK